MWKWLSNLDFFEILIIGLMIVGTITAIGTTVSEITADPVIRACEELIKKLPEEHRLKGMATCFDGADGRLDGVMTAGGDR